MLEKSSFENFITSRVSEIDKAINLMKNETIQSEAILIFSLLDVFCRYYGLYNNVINDLDEKGKNKKIFIEYVKKYLLNINNSKYNECIDFKKITAEELYCVRNEVVHFLSLCFVKKDENNKAVKMIFFTNNKDKDYNFYKNFTNLEMIIINIDDFYRIVLSSMYIFLKDLDKDRINSKDKYDDGIKIIEKNITEYGSGFISNNDIQEIKNILNI